MNYEPFRRNWRRLPHPIRWVVVATVGATLVVLGLVFMLIPGPGMPLFILGFAILATEFAWAQFVLDRLKHHGARFGAYLKHKFTRR